MTCCCFFPSWELFILLRHWILYTFLLLDVENCLCFMWIDSIWGNILEQITTSQLSLIEDVFTNNFLLHHEYFVIMYSKYLAFK